MPYIENYDIYNTRMKQSIYDKLFFIDKIFDENVDTILDFGCANGELINAVHSFLPHYNYIGYDLDPIMLKEAKEKLPFAKFYNNWDDIQVDPKKTIVVLSSVIHEVYTYSSHSDIELFWRRITGSGFKYVVVRDMLRFDEENPIENYFDLRIAMRKIRESQYAGVLKSFEDVWGEIRMENDLKHFLLKYRYTENWKREVVENYLPIAEGDLRAHFNKYKVLYDGNGDLPYLVHQVRKDFGVDISNWPTHVRLIFKSN